MKKFDEADRERIAKQYARDALYRAITTIGDELEGMGGRFWMPAEFLFQETAEGLTQFSRGSRGSRKAEIHAFWQKKRNEYKQLDRNVPDDDIHCALASVMLLAFHAAESSRDYMWHYHFTQNLMFELYAHPFTARDTLVKCITTMPSLPSGWLDEFIQRGGAEEEEKEEKKREKPRAAKSGRAKGKKAAAGSSALPPTLPYITHGHQGQAKKQGERVRMLFNAWQAWKWISPETSSKDFDDLFEGNARHCNIRWTANATILTIFLRDLLSYHKREGRVRLVREVKGLSVPKLMTEQFKKTPKYDEKRLTEEDKARIDYSLHILDITLSEDDIRDLAKVAANPTDTLTDDDYTSDAAARSEIYSGSLRLRKGI